MPTKLDATYWQTALDRAVLFLPHVAIATALFLIFWLVGTAAERLIHRTGEARKLTGDALFMLSRAVKLTLMAVGLVTALGTLGVDVTAMVTGLGLTGLAVGFALKDIISNSLAGILILIYKPFQRQDRIAVVAVPANLEGQVVHVDLRYTTLQLADRKILVPNANLFTSPIIVFQGPPVETAAPAVVAPTAAPPAK